MRGDSLRDLYAKTLALAGLGVLAGAGVLVDYWPVGLNLPRVTSALPSTSLPPRPPQLTLATTTDAARLPREARSPVDSAKPRVARALPAFPAVAPASDLGAVVDLEPLDQAPSLEPISVVAAVSVPDAAVPMPAGALLAENRDPVQSALLLGDDAPTLAAVSHEAEDGFVSDAFKKTGTSIVRTSRRTGASIVDAMRVVSGVVKRALPN